MSEADYHLTPIGVIRSPLKRREDAPRQARDGAPDAWLDLDPSVGDGLRGIAVGDDIYVITWLHLAARDTLLVHPRGDESAPLSGVFATRSPDRPNPLGLHRVTVRAIEGTRLLVGLKPPLTNCADA